jgi:hypothetical protein
VIEMLRSYEDSETLGLTFRWRGMTIYLEGMLGRDDVKYLSETKGFVSSVARITNGNGDIFTISLVGVVPEGPGTLKTSSGHVLNAISDGTCR